MANVPSGVDTAGKFLSAQKELLNKTQSKIANAKQTISKLKNKNDEYKSVIAKLEEELKTTKAKLAKGMFKNAGEKIIEQKKESGNTQALTDLRKRAAEINKELEKYKEIKSKYEEQLNAVVRDIKSNNERLTKINKDLDTMVVTTKMRFNMRSPTRATVITYPNRKKSRRSCKKGKLKKPVRTKKGGKRRCKKRKYTKRKRSRRRSRK